MSYENNPRNNYNSPSRYGNQSTAPMNPVITPVAEVKVAIDPTQRDLIAFKDKLFCAKLLSVQAGHAVTIEAEGEYKYHPDFIKISTPTRELAEELHNHDPIFARWEGGYVVVLGHKKALEQFKSSGRMKGKFLSNPTLKRALVA